MRDEWWPAAAARADEATACGEEPKTGGRTKHGTPIRLGFLHAEEELTGYKPTDESKRRQGGKGGVSLGDKSSFVDLLSWPDLICDRVASCVAPLQYGVLIQG